MPSTLSPKKRASVRFWGLLLLGISIVGIIQIVRTSPKSWARVVAVPQARVTPTTNTDENRLRESLEDITLQWDETVKVGALLDLAEFRTANGATVEISIVEGQFLDNEIAPKLVWQKLGDRLLLVNSVDQDQSTDRTKVDSTAMAYHVNPGCGISGLQRFLEGGMTDLHECKGPYTGEGIKWVDNVAVVTYEDSGTKEPCYNKLASGNDKYIECVKDDLRKGLQAVFEDARTLPSVPFGIVFPAVATGHGKLPKRAFYPLLRDTLLAELKRSEQSDFFFTSIPSHIYLRVDSQNDTQQWIDTRMSISSEVAQLVRDWNREKHESVDSWRALTGVSGALGILLLLVFGLNRRTLAGIDVSKFEKRPVWSLVVGWFFASLGLVKLCEPLTSIIPTQIGPWPEVTLAFIVVLFIVPLSLSIEEGKSLVLGKTTAAEEEQVRR